MGEGPLGIRFYGAVYAAGFLLTWWYLGLRARTGRLAIRPRDADPIALLFSLAISVGGRLTYVLLYRPDYFAAHLLDVLKPWQGGRSFHGAVAGCLLVGWFVVRHYGVPYLQLADALAVPLSFMQGVGRIANFANGEIYGTPTDLPWGVPFPAAGDLLRRHPVQLYEAIVGIAIGVVLFALRDRPKRDGALLGIWFAVYGAARVLLEPLREPPVPVGWLTLGQLLSAPMILAGIVLVVRGYRPASSGGRGDPRVDGGKVL